VERHRGGRAGVERGARLLAVSHQLLRRAGADPECPDCARAAEAAGVVDPVLNTRGIMSRFIATVLNMFVLSEVSSMKPMRDSRLRMEA
jgi:hypothetical protein